MTGMRAFNSSGSFYDTHYDTELRPIDVGIEWTISSIKYETDPIKMTNHRDGPTRVYIKGSGWTGSPSTGNHGLKLYTTIHGSIIVSGKKSNKHQTTLGWTVEE